MIDNETQTEEQPQPKQDKLVQVNNKLKRALQIIKEKIHQVVVERPALFSGCGDDTIERLDYIISALSNQATDIDRLKTEHQHDMQLNEDYEKQINQLKQNLLEKNADINCLQERLHDIEFNLKKKTDDQSSIIMKYESFAQEHDAMLQQHIIQSAE